MEEGSSRGDRVWRMVEERVPHRRMRRRKHLVCPWMVDSEQAVGTSRRGQEVGQEDHPERDLFLLMVAVLDGCCGSIWEEG